MLCIRVFNTRKESRRLGVLSQQTRWASLLKTWSLSTGRNCLPAARVSFVGWNVKERRSNGVVTLIRRGSFFSFFFTFATKSLPTFTMCCYLNGRPTCCWAPGGRTYSALDNSGLSVVGPVWADHGANQPHLTIIAPHINSNRLRLVFICIVTIYRPQMAYKKPAGSTCALVSFEGPWRGGFRFLLARPSTLQE